MLSVLLFSTIETKKNTLKMYYWYINVFKVIAFCQLFLYDNIKTFIYDVFFAICNTEVRSFLRFQSEINLI